ncbi:MAG: L-lactate permease [[Clostridium] scindens]
MNVPTNLFMWIMACLPIIVLLVLMIKFQWGVTEAAPAGLVITIVTGIVFYKADIRLLAAESAKGIWNALIIVLIVWTAILMYQVADEAKAFLVIRNGMRKLLPNELLVVLALGWILESFLQGITGFGVPVAVGAPLLIGIGVLPVWAVIIPLLGQSWGNTFGTLAAAWDALSMTAALEPGTPDYLAAAFWAGLFIWLWNIVIGLAICWFYGKGKAVKKGLPAVLIISLIQGGGELLLTQVNTTIACFIPACISLIALFFIGKALRSTGKNGALRIAGS